MSMSPKSIALLAKIIPFGPQGDMRVDSSPWGTFLVILTVVGFVMAFRYICSLVICHQADNTTESGTELQQVLVVHPDGGEAIAKRLRP